LTITALPGNTVYGQALTLAGTEFVATGLVNGDTVTTVALTSAGTGSAVPVGNYAIVPGRS